MMAPGPKSRAIELIAIVLLLVLVAACKKEITGPSDQSSATPGRRDYIWKVDTLNLDPFQSLDRMWGSSENDVWAIGTAGMWHYDSSGWKSVGHFSGLNWQGIFGFSSTNIWACTSGRGQIFHFDGIQWKLFGDYSIPGYSLTYIEDIWGESPSNIFAVGAVANSNTVARGIILRFDGTSWTFVNIPNLEAGFFKIVKAYSGDGKYYLHSEVAKYDSSSNPALVTGFVHKLFDFDGSSIIREIFSSRIESRWVSEINGRVYFSSSGHNSIWTYANDQFSVRYSNPDYSIGTLWGRTEKDIFAWCGYKGNYDRWILAHYNGTDLQPLFEADRFRYCAVFKNDVFLIIDGRARGIVRGSLPNLDSLSNGG